MPAGVHPKPERVSELGYLEAVPKFTYACLHSVEIAVHLAILTSNHAIKNLVSLYEKFCGPVPSAKLKLFRDADHQRVSQAERRARDAQKQHRQHLQSMALARESGHIADEGTTYELGAYSMSTPWRVQYVVLHSIFIEGPHGLD